MRKRQYIFVAALVLINLAIFFFRAHFTYHKYSDYKELYTGDISRWDQLYTDYSKDELAKADSLLKKNAGIDSVNGTLNKAVGIGLFLREQLHHDATGAKIIAAGCSPLVLFDSVKKNRFDIDCGHYSVLYPFFCYSQGIHVRYIQLQHPIAGHVFNEVYVPELKKWILVDLVHNLLSARNKGTYLDLWEFREAVRSGDSIRIQTAESHGLSEAWVSKETGFVKNYYLDSFTYYYFHYTDPARAYQPGEKLKRYFLGDYWLEIYGSERTANLPHYLKIGMLVLLIGAILYNLWSNDRG